MTSPACTDPASAVITTVMSSLAALFNPNSDCPPAGGGSTDVRFFAGDGAPIDEVSCDSPFLWVRLASRFRSEQFPEPSITLSPCGGFEVIQVEIGVARCAAMDTGITRNQYATEAETSLDDSWRIGKTLCLIRGLLTDHQIGADMVNPYGPEGGVIAWSTNIYISI